jgi:hypothetical protein
MTKTGAELPVLVGQAGPLNGERWSIDTVLSIGRDAACNVVIPDRQVSRYHARLIPKEEGILLEDLGSKNGTFYEGKRVIDPVFLQDGGLIQVALVQNFVYLSSDATVPLGAGVQPMEAVGGKLFLDVRSRRVWIGQLEVVPPLSVPQFRLLHSLYEHRGQVVPREELVAAIWGDAESEGVSEEAVDALVRRLRDRLATIDPHHAYIVTVRGHGLRLDNLVE